MGDHPCFLGKEPYPLGPIRIYESVGRAVEMGLVLHCPLDADVPETPRGDALGIDGWSLDPDSAVSVPLQFGDVGVVAEIVDSGSMGVEALALADDASEGVRQV